MDSSTIGHVAFELDSQQVLADYPNLKMIYDSEVPCLTGIISLSDEAGKVIDTYEILIKSSSNYPTSFPEVFELGGKIPKNIDWHIYSNGSCCIASPPEESLACIDGIDVSIFIKKHIFPYFYNQTFRRENGYFLNERSHGDLGWLEFFFEKLNTKNINIVIRALTLLSKEKKIDRTARCFCGSGKKFRKCHREAFNILARLPADEIKIYLHKLQQ